MAAASRPRQLLSDRSVLVLLLWTLAATLAIASVTAQSSGITVPDDAGERYTPAASQAYSSTIVTSDSLPGNKGPKTDLQTGGYGQGKSGTSSGDGNAYAESSHGGYSETSGYFVAKGYEHGSSADAVVDGKTKGGAVNASANAGGNGPYDMPTLGPFAASERAQMSSKIVAEAYPHEKPSVVTTLGLPPPPGVDVPTGSYVQGHDSKIYGANTVYAENAHGIATGDSVVTAEGRTASIHKVQTTTTQGHAHAKKESRIFASNKYIPGKSPPYLPRPTPGPPGPPPGPPGPPGPTPGPAPGPDGNGRRLMGLW